MIECFIDGEFYIQFDRVPCVGEGISRLIPDGKYQRKADHRTVTAVRWECHAESGEAQAWVYTQPGKVGP